MQSADIAALSNHDECPSCGTVTDLEEHHWKYRNPDGENATTWICRSCHLYIHNNQRASEQGDNWQQECVERLAMLDAMHNTAATADLRSKYNIPDDI